MSVVVAHCRAGFEPEAAADLAAVAMAAGTTVEVDAPPGRGYVVATPRAFDSQRWPRALEAVPPVFVRSLFFGTGPHALFSADTTTRGRPDRVAPLAALFAAFRRDCRQPGVGLRQRAAAVFGELRMETADTNEGKELSVLCRRLELPLAGELLADGALVELEDPDAPATLPALHVLFADGAHVFVGTSATPWGSPHAMGIPRLHLPRGAPSRSTLKLAEAIAAFLGDRGPELMRAGMRAVDLGAAPGGWTWQLAQRGLFVTAVDNGPLKGGVGDDPRVTHVRVDGLAYLPRRPVDWLVCDMVVQPARVATLVGRWIGEGHARCAIFNLKLPMKRRYDEMLRCRAIVGEALARAGVRHRLQLRQLYHDREEVTGFVERLR
jgi:23S rRNA (cytidine2498-2'-O)-methyltransferase